METGLVVFPFLPGESLIFFTSTIAAVKGSVLDIKVLVVVFFLAALIGDTVNFEIGRHLKQLPFLKSTSPKPNYRLAFASISAMAAKPSFLAGSSLLFGHLCR